jgi:hypothetical protein
MRGDILRVRTQYTLECILGAIELTIREVRFAQDSVGVEVMG